MSTVPAMGVSKMVSDAAQAAKASMDKIASLSSMERYILFFIGAVLVMTGLTTLIISYTEKSFKGTKKKVLVSSSIFTLFSAFAIGMAPLKTFNYASPLLLFLGILLSFLTGFKLVKV